MSEWSLFDGRYPGGAYRPYPRPEPPAQFRPPAPAQAIQFQPPAMDIPLPGGSQPKPTPKGESPRELRNRAEKQRRDIMHQSVTRLASIVPPVAMSTKKVDKTSVLRLTAHYLRAYKHVFGKSFQRGPRFSKEFTRSFLKTMKGFVLTTTYKGLMVVVSPNIQEYLGYTELELLGQSIYRIVHPEDHQLLKEQLFPRCCKLTSNGELLLPQEPNAAEKAAEALKHEKRAFMIRFKKLTHQRSEAAKYLTCHVEGSFRKSDDAGVYVDNHMQIGRRVRSRGNNPYASGNDIVFISVIRPITETFTTESRLETVRMEYRTRHSIDGSIIQCEHRISLITGYMIHEVNGVNAMNFMHRDDVRWVVVALREMYVNNRLMGESCYRLMTKNGKFIHMRTRGVLEVDVVSKQATSFVCTNTVVPEDEGSELIKQMKKKFSLKISNEEPMNDFTENPQGNEYQSISVEDPQQLERVIYHLVTDLPWPRPEENAPKTKAPNQDLSIIPPKREQIKRAIEKSYSVLKTLRHSDSKTDKMSQEQSPARSGQNSPNRKTPNSTISENSSGLAQIVQQYEIAVSEETQAFELHWTFADAYTWVDLPSTSSNNPDPNGYQYGLPSEFDQGRCNDLVQTCDDSASYNCLPRPAVFSNNIGTSHANNDENCGDARTAAEPFDIQIAKASTLTDGIDKFSCTQRRVRMANTVSDFEISPLMDSMTPEALLQPADEESLVRGAEQAFPILDAADEEGLVCGAEQAFPIINAADEEGLVRGAEQEFPMPDAADEEGLVRGAEQEFPMPDAADEEGLVRGAEQEFPMPDAADEEGLVCGAEQAFPILDAADEEGLVRGAEQDFPMLDAADEEGLVCGAEQAFPILDAADEEGLVCGAEQAFPILDAADEEGLVCGAEQAFPILDAADEEGLVCGAEQAFPILDAADEEGLVCGAEEAFPILDAADEEGLVCGAEQAFPILDAADEEGLVCGAEQAFPILDAADEEGLVCGAEQAFPILNESSIDMIRVAEPEPIEMECDPPDNNDGENQEQVREQNSPQAVPEPVAPVANNVIDNNDQYDPYEFVEDEESI